MEAVDGVIYLAKCAVTETKPEKEIIDTLDLDAVYREASRHMIAAMVGMSLQDAGVSTPSFKQAIAKAQRKTIVLDAERKKVFEELDKAGIWHMALKGSVIKDWYPRFGMRESADMDVLFDKSRAGDVRKIMEGIGYSTKTFGERHHDNYHKKPLACFEMHRDLMDRSCEKRIYDYYESIEDRLVKKGYEYSFIPEDFYLYALAHEYKHYNLAGTGLRSLIDTYIILHRHPGLDWSYIRAEAEKMGIVEFEVKNRNLASRLFNGELTADDREMLGYMIESGTYGTFENSINNYVEKHGSGLIGKVRYLLHRAFLPLPTIKRAFPTFYKYKIPIPFLPLYRLIRSFGGDKFNREMSILNGSKS